MVSTLPHPQTMSWRKSCRHYHMEISYSTFERTLELPVDLEPARIATEYKDGMLLVRIRTEKTS